MRCVKGALAADFFDFGSDDFPLKIAFKKVLPNRRFSALASRSTFGAANGCKCWSRCDVVLLCFASQCLQIAVEWLRQGSSLLQLLA